MVSGSAFHSFLWKDRYRRRRLIAGLIEESNIAVDAFVKSKKGQQLEKKNSCKRAYTPGPYQKSAHFVEIRAERAVGAPLG